MTKAELIEALADIEHERWGDWQAYVHTLGQRDSYGNLVLPAEKVEHWSRLIATFYRNLPEHSKQADRDQVARYWPLIVEIVAEWIEQNCRDFYEGSDEFVREWRDEMRPEQG